MSACRNPPRCRSQLASRCITRPISANTCELNACSIVQVDVARIGGITPWLKTAHLAETFNVSVCPHYLMEIHVALCAAIPNAAWVEYIPQLDLITDSSIEPADGYVAPSMIPGNGIEWNWKAIERMRVGHAVVKS